MKKILKSILIVGIAIISQHAVAQDTNAALDSAFAKSYRLEKKGDYTNAIKLLKSVYKADSYETNLRLGWLTYSAGLFTESTAYYQKSMDLMPYSLEAKFGYVLPASALGNWTQVEKMYKDILTIDPQNTKANYRLGSIYFGRKDYQTADKYFGFVVNLYPFDYDSSIMYAWTEYYLGKLRQAKVLFNKVLLISPGDTSAIKGLSLIK